MKQHIINFLVWALGKMDETRYNRLIIAEWFSVEVIKFVPDDDKWHQVESNIKIFFRRDKTKLKTKVKNKVFVDGLNVNEEKYEY